MAAGEGGQGLCGGGAQRAEGLGGAPADVEAAGAQGAGELRDGVRVAQVAQGDGGVLGVPVIGGAEGLEQDFEDAGLAGGRAASEGLDGLVADVVRGVSGGGFEEGRDGIGLVAVFDGLDGGPTHPLVRVFLEEAQQGRPGLWVGAGGEGEGGLLAGSGVRVSGGVEEEGGEALAALAIAAAGDGGEGGEGGAALVFGRACEERAQGEDEALELEAGEDRVFGEAGGGVGDEGVAGGEALDEQGEAGFAQGRGLAGGELGGEVEGALADLGLGVVEALAEQGAVGGLELGPELSEGFLAQVGVGVAGGGGEGFVGDGALVVVEGAQGGEADGGLGVFEGFEEGGAAGGVDGEEGFGGGFADVAGAVGEGFSQGLDGGSGLIAEFDEGFDGGEGAGLLLLEVGDVGVDILAVGAAADAAAQGCEASAGVVVVGGGGEASLEGADGVFGAQGGPLISLSWRASMMARRTKGSLSLARRRASRAAGLASWPRARAA